MGPAGACTRHGQLTAGAKVGEAPKMESSWVPSQCWESSQDLQFAFAIAIWAARRLELLGGLRFEKLISILVIE